MERFVAASEEKRTIEAALTAAGPQDPAGMAEVMRLAEEVVQADVAGSGPHPALSTSNDEWRLRVKDAVRTAACLADGMRGGVMAAAAPPGTPGSLHPGDVAALRPADLRSAAVIGIWTKSSSAVDALAAQCRPAGQSWGIILRGAGSGPKATPPLGGSRWMDSINAALALAAEAEATAMTKRLVETKSRPVWLQIDVDPKSGIVGATAGRQDRRARAELPAVASLWWLGSATWAVRDQAGRASLVGCGTWREDEVHDIVACVSQPWAALLSTQDGRPEAHEAIKAALSMTPEVACRLEEDGIPGILHGTPAMLEALRTTLHAIATDTIGHA